SHAGAALAARLPLRAGRDGAGQLGPVGNLPAPALAVAGSAQAAVREGRSACASCSTTCSSSASLHSSSCGFRTGYPHCHWRPLSAYSPAATSTPSTSTPSGSTGGSTSGGGDATAGKAVWDNNSCGSCHTLAAAGATGTVGPDLDTAISGDAGSTPLPEFVKESIIDPEKVIAKGFSGGI